MQAWELRWPAVSSTSRAQASPWLPRSCPYFDRLLTAGTGCSPHELSPAPAARPGSSAPAKRVDRGPSCESPGAHLTSEGRALLTLETVTW